MLVPHDPGETDADIVNVDYQKPFHRTRGPRLRRKEHYQQSS